MNRLAAPFAITVAMALAALLLIPRLHAPVSFDGQYMYLPMARAVLEKGWAYLQNPVSVSYPPLSFLYPALLAANALWVREANIALYCAAVALAYLSLNAASGRRAGVIGAFLVALSPTLRPYIVDVLSEPPFVFLVAAWALCVAKVAAGGRWPWAIAGGVAMALAILFRPAAMYFAPLAMLFFAWRRDWKLASMHGVATLAVGLWVLRNAIVFGFPAVAAGAGGALYFGVNPLVDGFDPPYYGMQFDSGIAQDSESHLSIHADRVLSAIAMTELRDTPLPVIAKMFAHKLVAFLFVTSAENSGEPLAWLRAWRIVLIIAAAFGVYANRRSAFAMTLAAFTAYMVAVHIPVLYTHRYSVGAIDYPLILLASLGIMALAANARHAAFALVAATFALAVGLVDASAPGPLAPHPERVPNEVLWVADIGRDARIPPGTSIDIGITRQDEQAGHSLLQVDFAARPAKPGTCTALVIRFREAAAEAFSEGRAVKVPLDADGRMHRYTIGSTVPLALGGSGTLRLEPVCTTTAEVRLGQVAVIAPRREIYYRDLYRNGSSR